MTGERGSVPREKSKDLLVSVIIPVYQVSDYVERCLLSVMSQTYQNIECIIVDDCSEDDSIAKCERLIDGCHGSIKFQILHHEQNRGLSAARNTGTNAATGDFLYYLDSDDEITSSCIEKLVSYVISDDSIEMVQGNYLKISDEKEELGKSDNVRALCNDDARDLFLNQRMINEFVWNKLLNRSFLVDNRLYNKEGIINEDLLWIFYVIKNLKNACLSKEVTYHYHIRPISIATSTNHKRQGESYAFIYNEIIHNLTIGKEHEELKGFLYNFCYNIAAYRMYAPELNTVLDLYKEQAKCHNYWFVYSTLLLVVFTSHFGNTLRALEKLNELRWKIK